MKLFCLEVDCTGQVVKKKKKNTIAKGIRDTIFKMKAFGDFIIFVLIIMVIKINNQ